MGEQVAGRVSCSSWQGSLSLALLLTRASCVDLCALSAVSGSRWRKCARLQASRGPSGCGGQQLGGRRRFGAKAHVQNGEITPAGRHVQAGRDVCAHPMIRAQPWPRPWSLPHIACPSVPGPTHLAHARDAVLVGALSLLLRADGGQPEKASVCLRVYPVQRARPTFFV